jgi:hypothetical protein
LVEFWATGHKSASNELAACGHQAHVRVFSSGGKYAVRFQQGTGTVGAVERAFHVQINFYQHPTEDRAFFALDHEPTVELPFQLWHVTGLDNYSIPRPTLVRRTTPTESNATTDPAPVLWNTQIQLSIKAAEPQWAEIIGVASNVKSYSEETRDDPQIYEPFLQRPLPSLSLMLRTSPDPIGLTPPLRHAVAQVDAELPLAHVITMDAVIDGQKNGDPFFTSVLGSFAILVLILAAIGIYGLIAYSVDQRTHEIGIRMALGAKRSDILRLVLREGTITTAKGSAIGLTMALPLPKVFEAIFDGHMVASTST